MKAFALKSLAQPLFTLERAGSNGTWRRWWPLLVLVAATMLPLIPIIKNGVPTGADMMNHYRFGVTFYDALRTGHLYPGWLASSNLEYGDPSVRFYPPVLYYLMAASRALTGDWFAATLPVFAVLTLLGVCGAYFWARAFVEPRFAVWAGLFYAIAPYRINESLEHFLLAEYAGGAALMFAFGFVEHICRNKRWSDVAGLSAAYAMLILTHLPLTVMGSLMLCLYALLRIERKAFWATVSRLGLGVLIGLAASSRYWVMMVSELGWIRAGTQAPTGWYDYRNNFLFTDFAYSAPVWWTNYIALATIVMFIPIVVLLRHKGRGLKALGILGLLSFFMTTSLSKPLWVIIPKLKDVQFPWRWLAITSAFCAVMMAVAIPAWIEKLKGSDARHWRKLSIVAGGCVLLSFCFLATHFMERAYYFNRQQFAEEINSLDGLRSHKDWWPVWVKGDKGPREMLEGVEVLGRNLSIKTLEAERRTFEVSGGNVTEARLRTLYYPNWTASAGGRVLTTRASEDGVLVVSLPADVAGMVEVEFREPLKVQAAALVTALGWILILSFLIFRKREAKN
ncbi:MAG TPA: 6-pyruvoyl-tetrahydropterin synthase-related protein [Pyrinomonadaceae bacterium]|jgi:hypothetical protein